MVTEVGVIIEPGIRIAPLSGTVNKIMKQRIDTGLAKLWIPIQIELGVKKRVRIVANPSSVLEVVLERIEIADVFVPGAIPPAVKQRMRIASLGCAIVEEVDERRDARGCDVRVRHQIPIGIEERVRIKGFEPT
jgi:hypothetical protein